MQQHRRCDGSTNKVFVGNLVLYAVVKEFRKSAKNWQSYDHGEGGTFLTHSHSVEIHSAGLSSLMTTLSS